MHSSPRNIRKRVKAGFHDMPSPRKTRCAKIDRSTEGNGLHLREPAIFALRFKRTRSREARLALSSNGQRLPPYIRVLLRARKSANAPPVPAVTMTRSWPHENPGLERVDRLLAEVRELGKRTAEVSPPFVDDTDRPTAGEPALPETAVTLPETAVTLAPEPTGILPDHKGTTAAPPEVGDRKDRQFVATRALEDAITGEVRAQPGCEAFVGVVLEKVKPKSSFDTNWELLGVKFGKTDRKTANEALLAIVSRMKNEFSLSDD
jgi:hypothetical protein